MTRHVACFLCLTLLGAGGCGKLAVQPEVARSVIGAGGSPSLGRAIPSFGDVSDEMIARATGEIPEPYFAFLRSMAAPDAVAGPVARGEAGGVAPLPQAPSVARQLIRTATIDLVSTDTAATAAAIEAAIAELGGFVAHSSASGEEGYKVYAYTARVPVERFDATRARIKGLATRIHQERVQTQDVTDQFVDLEARRRALEATENELLELLGESRERDHKVKDIMAIYAEVSGVRERIEQIRGRLNALGDRTALATITISVWPDEASLPVIEEGWSAMRTTRQSARSLVAGLQGLADASIRFVVVVLPFALLVAIPLLAAVRIGLRVRSRKGEKAAAA